jgi:hypothetical protein
VRQPAKGHAIDGAFHHFMVDAALTQVRQLGSFEKDFASVTDGFSEVMARRSVERGC